MTQQEKIPFPDTTQLSAEEAADQWLAYHQSGLDSAEGRSAFSAWLRQSPANRQAYTEAQQLWQDAGFALLQDAPDEVIHAPAANIEENKSRLQNRTWLRGVAATLLIGFSALNLTAQLSVDETTTSYASQIGEIKTLTLEDGSTVTLSADSRLAIHFTSSRRELNLLRGRAYFDVAPDKHRPFVVSAGNASATAVGTAFDVNYTAEGVDVAVTHGIVDVRGYRDAEHTLHHGKEQLFAGQIIHAATDGELDAVRISDNTGLLSWRSGRLVFEGEKLSVITEEINRYRHKKIRLNDSELQHRRITLSVPTDRTEQLISAIQASEPVRIAETDKEVIISLAR